MKWCLPWVPAESSNVNLCLYRCSSVTVKDLLLLSAKPKLPVIFFSSTSWRGKWNKTGRFNFDIFLFSFSRCLCPVMNVGIYVCVIMAALSSGSLSLPSRSMVRHTHVKQVLFFEYDIKDKCTFLNLDFFSVSECRNTLSLHTSLKWNHSLRRSLKNISSYIRNLYVHGLFTCYKLCLCLHKCLFPVPESWERGSCDRKSTRSLSQPHTPDPLCSSAPLRPAHPLQPAPGGKGPKQTEPAPGQSHLQERWVNRGVDVE